MNKGGNSFILDNYIAISDIVTYQRNTISLFMVKIILKIRQRKKEE